MGDAVVYFVQEGEGGNIKIGTTRRKVWERMRDFKTGNSADLRLLVWVKGGEQTEREMHALFSHLRVRRNGEWFRPAPDLLSFIDDVKLGVERAKRIAMDRRATAMRIEFPDLPQTTCRECGEAPCNATYDDAHNLVLECAGGHEWVCGHDEAPGAVAGAALVLAALPTGDFEFPSSEELRAKREAMRTAQNERWRRGAK